MPNKLTYSRYGIVTSKKTFGKAVNRNFVKRRIREAVLLNKEMINDGYDIIIIGRKPVMDAEFKQLTKVVALLLTKAGTAGKRDST